MPKKNLTLLQQEYLNVADLFLWGRQIDFTAWFTGEWRARNKQTETVLPQLERLNVIHTQWHKGMKVYTTSKRRSDTQIPHGLVCTLALLRLKLSRDGEFISEKFFRKAKFKAVPEWAVRYENSIVLFEYSTADNFRRRRLMKNKIARYEKQTHSFKDMFGVRPILLFVINASRHEIEYFAYQNGGDGNFYVDQKTFFDASIGEQLTSKIYTWGGNGEKLPLEK